MALLIVAIQTMVITVRFIERRQHLLSAASSLSARPTDPLLARLSGTRPRASRSQFLVFFPRLRSVGRSLFCSTTSPSFPNAARQPTWKEPYRHPWFLL